MPYYWILSLTIWAHVCSCSFASTTGNIKDTKASTQSNDPYDFTQHNNRMRKLDWIESELNRLNTRIPTPTPDEINWIKKEREEIAQIEDEAIKENREAQLYSSIPYNKNAIKKLLTTGLVWVKKIKSSTDLRKEMIYWVELANVISNGETLRDSLSALQGTVIRPKDPHLYFTAMLITVESNSILTGIIIPYIESGMTIEERINLDAELLINSR